MLSQQLVIELAEHIHDPTHHQLHPSQHVERDLRRIQRRSRGDDVWILLAIVRLGLFRVGEQRVYALNIRRLHRQLLRDHLQDA